MEFEAVVDAVRDRVRPRADERERLAAVVETLVDRAEAAIAELPVEADVVLVGSTARDTWLAGERDVDLFVRFPPSLDREALESYGLQVGHAVLPDGREEYAEHPYVTGVHDGFDVDCVPCFAVDDATAARTAVDRTPFHTAYLEDRIAPFADDVRLAKQLLSAAGAYGSDLRTRGFSGFLVELLVLEYAGFRGLIEAAADWQPPVRLDPAGHGTATFEDPLVVIDPTDPERNVAAVCSARNVARLVHYARRLLADPRPDLFEPADPDPLAAGEIEALVADRGTTPVAVRFPAPDIVDDQLYPQLDKSLSGLVGLLERGGFSPLRADRFAAETAVLLVECQVGELAAVVDHQGPPVGVREHAEGFYGTYRDRATVTGPYIDDDGRYVVERPREHRRPRRLVDARLFDVSLGHHVEAALEDGYDLLVGDEIASLADEFGRDLARYFDPVP